MDSLYKYSYFTPLQIHFRQKSIEKDHNQQNVYNSKIPSIPQGKWLYIARRNVCRLCNNYYKCNKLIWKYYNTLHWSERITLHIAWKSVRPACGTNTFLCGLCLLILQIMATNWIFSVHLYILSFTEFLRSPKPVKITRHRFPDLTIRQRNLFIFGL